MTSARPRILVTTSTFPRWSDDTEPAFVADLCYGLQQRGFDIDVLAPHAEGAQLQESMNGITVYRYRYSITGTQTLAYAGGILANLKHNPFKLLLVPLLLLGQTWALYKRLNTTDYELVHAHWLIPQGALCAFLLRLRRGKKPAMICTSHGGDLFGLDNPLFNAIKKWTISRCTYICVVSKAMQKRVMELGVPESKSRVMPMGVDLTGLFRPVPGVERRSNRIIFVGRLVEKKGVSVLLSAMPEVVRQFPDTELIVVGDGPLRQALEQQVRQLDMGGHVHFYGSVTHAQLPELYSSAAIAVVPSIVAASGDQEGLGLVIIEALGCGCAVVASSLAAISDVIDEQTGCLVRPGDVADMIVNLSTLLNDTARCTQMAERGRASVMGRFDRSITDDKYYRLITECIATA